MISTSMADKDFEFAIAASNAQGEAIPTRANLILNLVERVIVFQLVAILLPRLTREAID
ncbi:MULTISPECIES: hypothetical protein [unclassified Mesorhizobium]|uniref:hypothetical protein n=1 Tax=unclassified Mesorhizobium TaxID=325217 RepID=UPI001676DFDF|nr:MULTISPECIES: hypothetical protein [unclassified Mesorhizobium]